jgi:hypothetical protein
VKQNILLQILYNNLDHLGFLQLLHHFLCLQCHSIHVRTVYLFTKTNHSILHILAHLPPPPFNAPSAFFPIPPSPSNSSSGFIPPPFLPPPPTAAFPLPSPELLSKMLQTPPPPLPVPAPVNTPSPTITNTNIKNEDLYDPLQAEDDEDEEEDTEQKTTPIQKPINRIFNIKKEHTIKIEPSMFLNNLIIKNLCIFFRPISIQKYKL